MCVGLEYEAAIRSPGAMRGSGDIDYDLQVRKTMMAEILLAEKKNHDSSKETIAHSARDVYGSKMRGELSLKEKGVSASPHLYYV